jgi:hypothetical protein
MTMPVMAWASDGNIQNGCFVGQTAPRNWRGQFMLAGRFDETTTVITRFAPSLQSAAPLLNYN